MDLAEWTHAGRALGAMGRYSQWGIGDWLHYGNAKFGEKYVRAAKITGYDVQTLMNMAHVASRFEISRRRENLSWSHHEAVAALAPCEQESWLDLAMSNRMSVSDLRGELRAAKRTGSRIRDVGAPSGAKPGPITAVCPECKHQFVVLENRLPV